MENTKYIITVTTKDGKIKRANVGPNFNPTDLFLFIQRQLWDGATQVHIVKKED